MGKGDKKSKRGKIWGGSCGVRRPKRKKTLHFTDKMEKADTKIKKSTSIASKASDAELKAQVLEPHVAEIITETKTEVATEPKTKATSVKKETAKKTTTKKEETVKKEIAEKTTTKKTTAKKADDTKETKKPKQTKKPKNEEETE